MADDLRTEAGDRPGISRHLPSRKELLASGKALHKTLPRSEHAIWKAKDTRGDPLSLLTEGDKASLEDLLPIKYGRMLQSPFAFFRGSVAIMAADLATTPTTGFRVQACGDCHVGNFGGFATPERNIIFDLNDFDETLPAPWEWDVKRLAASIVLAARSQGLSDSKARDGAEAAVRSYRKKLMEFSEMSPLESWYAKVTADDVLETYPPAVRKRASKRIAAATARSGSEVDYPKLAGAVGGKIRIHEQPPLIFHPGDTQTPEFEATLLKSLQDYRSSLSEDRQCLFDQYHLVDASIKVVGVGSVGRRCWIALFMSINNSPLILQFKEASTSALEAYAGASAFDHPGKRIVMGQRLMQPVSDIFLGWLTTPTGRHYYVRQLRDAKIKPNLETFNVELLEIYAKSCGWVLARAHAKGGDVTSIAGYLGSGDAFDTAVGKFGLAYADQAEKDHAALRSAVKKGRIKALVEA